MHALELVLLLEQRPDGARLAELAEAGAMQLSAAQAAMRLLVAEGTAEASAGPRPRYRLREEHPAHAALLPFAARSLPVDRAFELVLRGSPAVEFAARDEQGYLIVESALAEPVHLVALQRGLSAIRSGREDELPVTVFEHDDLRDRLLDDPAPRERARRAKVVKGRIARSFPDRSHRAREGRPLGRPHPDVPRLSQRRLRAIAREHGLRRIGLFGSAVRSDFRPDSDVDVLIEAEPDARLSLLDIVGLEHELEGLFDRDVDVAEMDSLRPRVRERAERELVELYARG